MEAREDYSQSRGANKPPQFDPSKISLWRMVFCMIGLWACLFLSALETTIVATALNKISSDLDSLGMSSWIIVAYLLTYNGFLLLFSKLTDIFGQKSLLILAQLIFLVFSMACGAAQTMTQLIVFRALQGIGGSGIYSTVFVIVTKIITPDKIGLYTGILTSVFAIASLLGPILGGVIVDDTTWRWIFFLNGPGIVLSLALVIPGIPSLGEKVLDKKNLQRVDVIGGILSLAWPTMLVFALEEGGESYAWNSGTIIGTLVGGGVALIIFIFFERWVQHYTKKEPILPIRLLKSPRLCLNLLTMFCLGVCFYASIVLLPQRFQAVDGLTPMSAGIHLLPFTITSPVFSIICGFVLGKAQKSAVYLIGAGAALIVVGIALLGSLPTNEDSVVAAVYGYEVILAAGTGFIMPPLVFLLKIEFNDADLASAMGVNNTSRTLGGCVGLAVTSTVLHSQLKNLLNAFLNPSQVAALLSSSSSSSDLSPSEVVRVKHAYATSYNAQFRALLAFACVGLVSAIVLGFLGQHRARKRPVSQVQSTFIELNDHADR
ncbi:putative MFS multidrug transporter [Talaromyces proteolyticus]|uniref:MFS multidrug transporter n=1 Tax=Talaromyces proteolyticus TaxID=1131652 RepID=A0AAD4L1A4_9EURO|nr:putative MFS multidrug transporter [Talaromyces proteolyticus]KAH8701069.1 putative MFS multidrug transporter [Talaromyces proteolyticus]